MALEQEISKGIMEAMKAKDTVRLTTLRNVKKYIIEAKISFRYRQVSMPVLKITKLKTAKQGGRVGDAGGNRNCPDLAAEESAQVAVLQTFLPKQMTGEELTEAVRSIIAEVGATSMKEMGKVMGVASKKLAGMADGKDISAKVKELLFLNNLLS